KVIQNNFASNPILHYKKYVYPYIDMDLLYIKMYMDKRSHSYLYLLYMRSLLYFTSSATPKTYV
ncbi:hypothetical protein NDI41_26780, partial [Leptolyngbya sp. NM2-A1]